MGAVYEAIDERTKSPRALKVMLPHLAQDAEMRVRFAQEARIVGDIESDHLVRVLDAGIDEATGAPFLVMELLRGDELGQLLKRRGPLSAEDVVLYLHQAALALDKTHTAGVVHRDLKPENLFVTRRDDGTACVKILDFGVAKIVHGHGGGAGTRSVGTPLYMAPEQILGHSTIGPRTDVYALGHVAFTLLVGKPYWSEEATSKDALLPLLARVSAGPVEPPSVRSARWNGTALPETFDAWFFRATARDPAARFDNARMAIGALAEAMRGFNATATIALPLATNTNPSANASQGMPLQTDADRSASLSIPMNRRRGPALVIGGLVVACGIIAFVAMQRMRSATAVASEAAIVVTASATAPMAVSVEKPEVPPASVTASVEKPVAVRTSAPAPTPKQPMPAAGVTERVSDKPTVVKPTAPIGEEL